jgi:hypothetical protein
MFISNQEPGPLEEDAVNALREILGTDEYNDGKHVLVFFFFCAYVAAFTFFILFRIY